MKWLRQVINPAERGLLRGADSLWNTDGQRKPWKMWMFLEGCVIKREMNAYRWDGMIERDSGQKQRRRWQDEGEGQGGLGFVHLALYTELNDPSNGCKKKINVERWTNEERKRKVRKGKEEKSKEKRRFTESWRVNQKHKKNKEPKCPPWILGTSVFMYLHIYFWLKCNLSVSFLFKKNLLIIST